MLRNTIEEIGISAFITCFVILCFGNFIGAVYWAMKEDVLNVVLSIFIPLYGIASILFDLIF